MNTRFIFILFFLVGVIIKLCAQETLNAEVPTQTHNNSSNTIPVLGVEIEYHLPGKSSVDLSIYSSLGQEFTTLFSAEQSSGTYQVEWNAFAFPSGVYLSILSTGEGMVQKNFFKEYS